MSSFEEQHVLKCLQCGGALDPKLDKCPYCGYYSGLYSHAKARPEVYIQPEPEVEEDDNSSYQSTSELQRGYLRQVIYFSVLLLVVTIVGSTFTNATIQADFTAAAVAAAGLLGVVLFLAAVKLVEV